MIFFKRVFLAVVIANLLGGCGAFHDATESSSSLELRAFSVAIRPILATNCFSCHAQLSNQIASSALYLDRSDSQRLFDSVNKKIKKGDSSNSLLLIKATGGAQHVGGNALFSNADREKVRQWIDDPNFALGVVGEGESTEGNVGSNLKLTPSQPIPSDIFLRADILNRNGKYQYVRFSLSGLGFGNAFVEVSVNLYTEDVYEFSNWKVYSPDYRLKINGINILVINGKNQYIINSLNPLVLESDRSQVIDSQTIPLPTNVLSNRGAIGAKLGTNDTFKLGFEDVRILQ